MLELPMTILIMILSLSYYRYYHLTGFIVTNDYPHNQRSVINRFQICQKYLKFHFYFQINKFNFCFPFYMYVNNSEDNCNNHKNNDGDNDDQNDENDNDNIDKTCE